MGDAHGRRPPARVEHPESEVVRRCRQHRLTEQRFVGPLDRLAAGARSERAIYDSFVDDVIGARDPLELFPATRLRSGIWFIEALFRVHAERAETGDLDAVASLPALGYARWLAWRRFGTAVRAGAATFDRRLDRCLADARAEVAHHLRLGWRPLDHRADPELAALLAGLE